MREKADWPEPSADVTARHPSIPGLRLGALPAAGILVVTDENAWRQMQEDVDRLGPETELSEEEAFTIARDTARRVLSRTATRARILVLAGPHFGRSGWTVPEWADAPAADSRRAGRRGGRSRARRRGLPREHGARLCDRRLRALFG